MEFRVAIHSGFLPVPWIAGSHFGMFLTSDLPKQSLLPDLLIPSCRSSSRHSRAHPGGFSAPVLFPSAPATEKLKNLITDWNTFGKTPFVLCIPALSPPVKYSEITQIQTEPWLWAFPGASGSGQAIPNLPQVPKFAADSEIWILPDCFVLLIDDSCSTTKQESFYKKENHSRQTPNPN